MGTEGIGMASRLLTSSIRFLPKLAEKGSQLHPLPTIVALLSVGYSHANQHLGGRDRPPSEITEVPMSSMNRCLGKLAVA